jgi:hypothetical protein
MARSSPDYLKVLPNHRPPGSDIKGVVDLPAAAFSVRIADQSARWDLRTVESFVLLPHPEWRFTGTHVAETVRTAFELSRLIARMRGGADTASGTAGDDRLWGGARCDVDSACAAPDVCAGFEVHVGGSP